MPTAENSRWSERMRGYENAERNQNEIALACKLVHAMCAISCNGITFQEATVCTPCTGTTDSTTVVFESVIFDAGRIILGPQRL